MRQWIAGLKLWHRINETPWYGGTELERAIQGASHFAPPSSFSTKRDPVTMLHLHALHNHLDLTDTFNIAVFAVACVAFWSCSCLGELLIDSNFNPALCFGTHQD